MAGNEPPVYATLALFDGTPASIWGQHPVRGGRQRRVDPVFDPQSDLYDAVLGVLDAAIADLQAGAGEGPGDQFVTIFRPGYMSAGATPLGTGDGVSRLSAGQPVPLLRSSVLRLETRRLSTPRTLAFFGLAAVGLLLLDQGLESWDGSQAKDTCILDQVRVIDVDRVEIYTSGFTTLPGYLGNPNGLILVFLIG